MQELFFLLLLLFLKESDVVTPLRCSLIVVFPHWARACKGRRRLQVVVSVRFGCLECRKRKKRTLFPELFLSFNLIGLQDQQRRERRWRERCCVLLGFSLQFFFFPTNWVWSLCTWGGEGVNKEEIPCWRSGLTPVWPGKRSSWGTAGVSRSPPWGLTVCLQAVALAAAASSLPHHYVSKETIHRKKKKKKKKNWTKFQQDLFSVSGIPEERVDVFSLLVQFIHLLCLYCHYRRVTVL